MKVKNNQKEPVHPLQTKAWSEFRKAWGNEVWETKYGIITLHKIPFLPYKLGMFIKGPKPTEEMLEWLKAESKKRKVIFIKLEPNVAFGDSSMKHAVSSKEKEKYIKLLKKYGCVKGKTLFTPTTFQIDLTKSEEELMKGFSSKTRYNIRLAQKHGVTVTVDSSEKAFENYIKLMRETVQRQGFYAHSEKYHRLMWEYLRSNEVTKKQKNPSTSLRVNSKFEPIARLLVADYKREIIAAWILFVNDGVLYYPYGASTEKYKQVMASSLMMWEAIRFGKKIGCHTFDLWGREEGKGFTKFKEGFNPKVVEFLGTWDLVINKPVYKIYRVLEQIRWRVLRYKSKMIKPDF